MLSRAQMGKKTYLPVNHTSLEVTVTIFEVQLLDGGAFGHIVGRIVSFQRA